MPALYSGLRRSLQGVRASGEDADQVGYGTRSRDYPVADPRGSRTLSMDSTARVHRVGAGDSQLRRKNVAGGRRPRRVAQRAAERLAHFLAVQDPVRPTARRALLSMVRAQPVQARLR